MTADRPLPALTVEIWSDVVCPWCYIGKRRFEKAVAELDGEIAVDAHFRAYQLDPGAAPGVSEPVIDAYARKFGGPDAARQIIERVTGEAAGEGLGFRLDRARRANTLLAHRLLWWCDGNGGPVEQAALKERLLQAYFVDGLEIGDPDGLAGLVAEIGGDRDEAAAFLAGDGGRAGVAAQIEQAAALGITAVPTYVVAGRWSVPGAQSPETFVNVLRRVAEMVAVEMPDAGEACADEVCER